MAEIVKLAKFRRSRTKAIEGKAKPKKFQKRQKGHKWPSFRIATRAMPLATELTKSREPALPVPQDHPSSWSLVSWPFAVKATASRSSC